MQKFGIIFSSKARSILLSLLGIWVFGVLASMCYQAVSAYRAGGGFDTPIVAFWVITLCLFAPYFIVTGYMLRSLSARVAFYRLVRRQIVIPEYQPNRVLSPAEAGELIDNTFELREVAATLKDLELRGVITVNETSSGIRLECIGNGTMTDIETTFLQDVFGDSQIVILHTSSASSFIQAGHALAARTRQKLIDQGILATHKKHTVYKYAFKIFLVIALIVQSAWTIALIVNPQNVFGINYPRYPMNVSEPTLICAVAAGVAILALSGFWIHTLTDKHGPMNWRYVAGLKVFIATVYKDRFKDGASGAASADIRTYYPYAIALGLADEFPRKLERTLMQF